MRDLRLPAGAGGVQPRESHRVGLLYGDPVKEKGRADALPFLLNVDYYLVTETEVVQKAGQTATLIFFIKFTYISKSKSSISL